jgi:hypothetical protein
MYKKEKPMNINQRINEILKSTKAALELMEIEKDNLEIFRDLEKVIRQNNNTLIVLSKVRHYLATREKV